MKCDMHHIIPVILSVGKYILHINTIENSVSGIHY